MRGLIKHEEKGCRRLCVSVMDFAAVALPWSNGHGRPNSSTKLMKRQMYGRAKFNLLRRRDLPYVAAAVSRSRQSALACTKTS
jgi:hypothetical protein